MVRNSVTVTIDISYGELLDKISILTIKLANARNGNQRANINREFILLTEACDRSIRDEPEVDKICGQLREINLSLWSVEDDLRAHERHQKFDAEFVELARSVYKLNDQRAALKRELNIMLGSPLIEEKLYERDEHPEEEQVPE